VNVLEFSREGITTGTCAAAAARAAAGALTRGTAPDCVDITLPAGNIIAVKIAEVATQDGWARATVIKYAGSDRDITDGAEITASVRLKRNAGITVRGGPGVGMVTLAGLQIPVGQHAINPVPHRMIEQAVSEYLEEGPEGLDIEISVPRGEELAEQTFNPRLGILGGISILGTTGIVRPMCQKALICSLIPALDVASANGIGEIFLVPGNIGRVAVLESFAPDPLAVVEMSNYPGAMLEHAFALNFNMVVLAGHPGKLAKLLGGHFCTDSAVSPSAVKDVLEIARKNKVTAPGSKPGAVTPVTIEGIIKSLNVVERHRLFHAVAAAIRQAVTVRFGMKNLAVWLCDMQGREVGAYGIR
jgi:cobalt-precorrin-5B (C1)-methyltransferase